MPPLRKSHTREKPPLRYAAAVLAKGVKKEREVEKRVFASKGNAFLAFRIQVAFEHPVSKMKTICEFFMNSHYFSVCRTLPVWSM